MAPVEDQHERTDEEEKGNKECLHSEGTDATAMMGRKLKRKLLKKEKRKQARREAARREREEEEARLNDPEEQLKLKMMEEEEAERMERDRLEFEERERRFLEALKQKMKLEEMEQEEEERRKLEESQRRQVENENSTVPDEGSDWEYVEEGPAEIIWQGNEITVTKKMVKVPKKKLEEQSSKKDIDRPISNPLAPQSEAFEDFKSAQEILDSVAQQVPNFGTEQDKAHCPFHLKTGACRFGTHCSRVHFYPDKSCTLLLKNMYNGSGLAWEQDEGLEYTEEEIERDFEDFYEDVHTEFLKFGEIVNFKVCKNGSSHLRGNVYVHYKYLESAVLAYHSINGRYFAGKQVTCEFVNVTKWKVAICGEFMKSKYKTCSRGSTCNFIHCFRNPGGDYEWADFDKSAPRHWVRKMGTLFGYKDDYDKQMGSVSPFRRTSAVAKTVSPDGRSHHSRRRSRSRDLDMRRRRNYYDDDYDRDTTRTHRSSLGSNRKVHSPARDTNEEKIQSKRVRHSGRKKAETGSDDDQSDGNRKSEEHHHTHKRSYRRRGRERRKISPDTDSETDMFVRYDHKTDGAKCNKSSDADRSKNLLHDDDLDSEPSSFGSDKIERRKREERYSRSKRKGQRWRDSEPKYSDNESTREDSRHRRIISELPSQHSYSERSSRDDKAGSLRTEGKKSDLIDYNSQEDRGSRPVSSRKRGRDGHGESKRHHMDKRASPRHSRDLLIHGSDKDSSKEETKVGNGGEDDSHFDGDQDGGRVSTRRRVKEGEPNSYSEVEHKNKVNHEEGSSSERGRNEENVENDEDDDDVLGYKENTVVDLGTEEEKAHRCAALKKLEEKKRAKEKLVHQDSGRVVSLRSNDDAGGSMLIENNVVVGEVPKYEKADIHSRKRLRI